MDSTTLTSLFQAGKIDEVLRQGQQLVISSPNDAQAHHVLGLAYLRKGQAVEASQSIGKAVKLDSFKPMPHFNLGLCERQLGENRRAMKCFATALNLNPPKILKARCLNSMAQVFQATGQDEQAVTHFERAIEVDPSQGQLVNLGNALLNCGESGRALDQFLRVLARDSENEPALYGASMAARSCRPAKHSIGLQRLACKILDHGHVRPQAVTGFIDTLLMFDPEITKFRTLISESNISIEDIAGAVPAFAKNQLLRKYIQQVAIGFVELSSMLLTLRKAMVKSYAENRSLFVDQDFLAEMAIQFSIREFVDSSDKEEEEALNAIVQSWAVDANLDQSDRLSSALIIACYQNIHDLEGVDQLKFPENLQHVKKSLISDYATEAQLKAEMVRLTPIEDETSKSVQDQYEESPYPRWISFAKIDPDSLSQIAQKSNLKISPKFPLRSGKLDILVAGGGTGQHALSVSQTYKDCEVLAIDLSLSSLAYAKRKSIELGIENVEFAQADILRIGELQKTFNVIESAGVLHHMDDPIAGWRALTDVLESGGLMYIALYSELARTEVVKARDLIAELGIKDDLASIRDFRNRILEGEFPALDPLVAKFSDFNSLSEFRDLVFHRQEHRFTLPQIKRCMAELGLEFAGFMAGPIATGQGPKGTDSYDLDKWHDYELENPDSFAAMYQFYCQKVS